MVRTGWFLGGHCVDPLTGLLNFYPQCEMFASGYERELAVISTTLTKIDRLIWRHLAFLLTESIAVAQLGQEYWL